MNTRRQANQKRALLVALLVAGAVLAGLHCRYLRIHHRTGCAWQLSAGAPRLAPAMFTVDHCPWSTNDRCGGFPRYTTQKPGSSSSVDTPDCRTPEQLTSGGLSKTLNPKPCSASSWMWRERW